jgi:hypothetical protein
MQKREAHRDTTLQNTFQVHENGTICSNRNKSQHDRWNLEFGIWIFHSQMEENIKDDLN